MFSVRLAAPFPTPLSAPPTATQPASPSLLVQPPDSDILPTSGRAACESTQVNEPTRVTSTTGPDRPTSRMGGTQNRCETTPDFRSHFVNSIRKQILVTMWHVLASR